MVPGLVIWNELGEWERGNNSFAGLGLCSLMWQWGLVGLGAAAGMSLLYVGQ